MTEEKTCYNCGNPNCHIPLNSVRINVKEHHETYDWDMEFDCTNHDKWEELKVEEIRTDNTETLKNALERIKELEKENTELKAGIEKLKCCGNCAKYNSGYGATPCKLFASGICGEWETSIGKF